MVIETSTQLPAFDGVFQLLMNCPAVESHLSPVFPVVVNSIGSIVASVMQLTVFEVNE